MITTAKSLHELTAGDLMKRELICIDEDLSLRQAAQTLFQNHISGAPVIDANGRCIGVLSTRDVSQWAAEGAAGLDDHQQAACAFQKQDRLPSGEDVITCTLPEGSCSLQVRRTAMGGRPALVCLQPMGVLTDWQTTPANLPKSAVHHYLTSDLVLVGPEMPLPILARIMVDARIHRLIVVDEQEKPIGIVTSTDILSAVAQARDDQQS